MILHGLKSACAFYRRSAASIATAARAQPVARHAGRYLTVWDWIPTLTVSHVIEYQAIGSPTVHPLMARVRAGLGDWAGP